MTLEERIEAACMTMPMGWRVEVVFERGSAWVNAVRPDGTVVPIEDDECDLAELAGQAVRLAEDETFAGEIGHGEECGAGRDRKGVKNEVETLSDHCAGDGDCGHSAAAFRSLFPW